MRSRELVACALVVAAAAPAAAKGKKDKDADDADVVTVDDADPAEGDQDAKPAKKKARKPANDDDGGGDGGGELQKQDLNGHDLGAAKKENVFERDRFFVDKTDSAKTEKGTLIQGSFTETSFAYHESGGNIPVQPGDAGPTQSPNVPSASQFNRLYTELRLQTDFRHIGGGRWDARIDVRGRVVNDPGPTDVGYTPATDSRVQSGFLGKNELDVKEAWLVRNGIQSDVFIGRQFIPDLGGVKIDGLRIDYASSAKFTLLGFGGLYPIRGSRSITDDYTPLLSSPDANGDRTAAGRFTGAGGFGAAYRTPGAYGSFGGVVLAPFSSESPRAYATSSGYWRYGSQLDFYHFVILDAVGSNTTNAGLTNVSLGLNWKPDQRLRGTLSYNRVDTETLNVQAQAFLDKADPALNAVQNEAFFQRIATDEARASLSAGLGELQRFEITAAATYRRRGEVTLSAPPQTTPPAQTFTLPSAQSAEIYGSITDRRSFKDLRLGVDGARSFPIGNASFERTTTLQVRGFAAHELSNGHGEWEAEVAYSTTKDDGANATVGCTDLLSCFGSATSTILSAGGTLYYRLNRDWFLLGSAFVNRTTITSSVATSGAVAVKDPATLGLSGLFRISYRF